MSGEPENSETNPPTVRLGVDDTESELGMSELITGAAPRLLTTTEAAEILNVAPRTILNWIANDSIPYLKLPSTGGRPQYRIPLQGLLSSLAGNYDLESDLKRADEAAKELGLTEQQADELIQEAEQSDDLD